MAHSGGNPEETVGSDEDEEVDVYDEATATALLLRKVAASKEAEQPNGSPSLLPPLKRRQLVWLNIPWLALSFTNFILSVVLIPDQILMIVGYGSNSSHTKGLTLGLTIGLGAVISLTLSPLVGLLSDRTKNSWGRRRIWMVIGSLVMSVCMLLMGAVTATVVGNDTYCDLYDPASISATNSTGSGADVPICKAPSIALYAICYLFSMAGYVMFSVPYHGLIADKTPQHERGFGSGVMGLFTALGTLLAACLAIFYVQITIMGTYAVTVVVVLLCVALCCWLIPETQSFSSNQDHLTCADIFHVFYAPLKEHDFRWVFLTRFLMQIGISTVSFFMEYFMKDVIVLPSDMAPSRAVALVFLPLLLVAAPSSIFAGYFSDHYGQRRKIFVIVSGLILAVCTACLCSVSAFPGAVAVAVFIGIGFGIFLSVDFAMVMDVLPSAKENAQDLAVWHQALVLPQMVATPIGGLILDAFSYEDCVETKCHASYYGYVTLFIITAVYFLLGTLFVFKIRRVK